MTDFRARGTIMGPAGLTAVFGMGTGVAPPVWSPGSRPGGDEAPPAEGRCGGSRPLRHAYGRLSLSHPRAPPRLGHGPPGRGIVTSLGGR